MFKLKLSILCLIAYFNATSQTVTLSDSIARLVIKDLIAYDFCKHELNEKDSLILNLTHQKNILNNTISINDEIVNNQKEYISIQKDIINNFSRPKFHMLAGVASERVSIDNIYAKFTFDMNKLIFGATGYIKLYSSFNYGLFIEYKIF